MLLALTLSLLVFLVLAFRGLGFLAWLAGAAVLLVGWRVTGVAHPALFAACVIALVALAVLFGLPALRRQVASRFIMPRFAKVLPRLGETERIALEAGTVWWDADLFAGIPPWQKLLDFQIQPPSAEELEFLNGPVEELCRRLNDWDVEQRRDLPPDIWAFLKEQRCAGAAIQPMRRYKSLIASGEKGQVFGLFRSNYLIDEAPLLGAGRKSPETHPIPGDKNKVLAAEDRQAPHL